MELSALDAALSAVNSYDSIDSLSAAASMVMLDNTLEQSNIMNQEMIKMMENSVTPHIGGNIDLYA